MAPGVKYGTTPWGQAFITALGSMTPRLERGKTLANTGKVLSTKCQGTRVAAKVQGSFAPFYAVAIEFREFTAPEKEAVYAAITSSPILLGHILNGELPRALLDELLRRGVRLLPGSFDEVHGSCDCPDNAGSGGPSYWRTSSKGAHEPCKHQAAVYYVLTAECDKNPFTVFTLRGIDLQKHFCMRHCSTSVAYPLEVSERATPAPEADAAPARRGVARMTLPPLQDQAPLILACLGPRPTFSSQVDYHAVLAEFFAFVRNERKLQPLTQGFARDFEDGARLERQLRQLHFRFELQRDLRRAAVVLSAPEADADAAGSPALPSATSGAAELLRLAGVPAVLEGDQIRVGPAECLRLMLQMSSPFGSQSYTYVFHLSRVALWLVSHGAVVPDVLPLRQADAGCAEFAVVFLPFATSAPAAGALAQLRAAFPAAADGACVALGGVPQPPGPGTAQAVCVMLTRAVRALGFRHAKWGKRPPAISLAFWEGQAYEAMALEERSVAAGVRRWVGVLQLLKLDLAVSVFVKAAGSSPGDDQEAAGPGPYLLSIRLQAKGGHAGPPLPPLEADGSTTARATADPAEPLPLSAFYAAHREHQPKLLQFLSSLSAYLPGVQRLLTHDALTLEGPVFERFITETSATLSSLGCELTMPRHLRRLLKPRLVIAATAAAREEGAGTSYQSFLKMAELLRYEWKVALGDGEMVSLAEFHALVARGRRLVHFRDAFVMLDAKEVQAILERAQQPPDVSKLQAMDLLRASMLEAQSELRFSGYAAELLRSLTGRAGARDAPGPDAPPAGLAAALRPYQLQGFQWLAAHAANGMGCVLADDMGLGKTLQAIALLLHLKGTRSPWTAALVVVPSSLMYNWRREMQRFAPTLRVMLYHGADRGAALKKLLEAGGSRGCVTPAGDRPAAKRQRVAAAPVDVVLTSYGTLKAEAKSFVGDQGWSCVIVDEAQTIKNPNAQITRTVKALKAPVRVALSGTPIENKLSELHSIFDYAIPGLLGPLKEFSRQYGKAIEQRQDEAKLHQLRRLTAPFLLRRLKTDKAIIADLPDKVAIDEYAALSAAQAAMYQAVVDNTLDTLAAARDDPDPLKRKESRGLVLSLISALKQICNHPANYKREGAAHAADRVEDSGKMTLLMDLLEPIVAAGDKVLIFSQYARMCQLLQQMLQRSALGVRPLVYEGSMSQKQRDHVVRRFASDPSAQVLILSLKAGGVGLNLTQANHVIHYDLWWNPQVEAQATDRAFRIGQAKNVFVHRLVTRGTFEEKINAMMQRKRELAELTVASGESWLGDLSSDELKDLFALSSDLTQADGP